jgi:hypothetical protein
MADHFLLGFRRAENETHARFAERLQKLASGVAAARRVRTAVLFAADAAVGAPEGASSPQPSLHGALLLRGLPEAELPASDFALAIDRRVIKARSRGRDGARSPGFTLLCPSVRKAVLTHAQFDAHWRDNHGPIHVASSPGTCHYEQLPVNRVVRGSVPAWDGVGLLSFATAADFTQRMFDGERGQRAIYEDIPRFLALEAGETLAASEYVFRDDA